MRFVAFFILCLLMSTSALAENNAVIDIYDRTDNRSLPIYEHEGRLYVAGEPRHQYEIRIHSRSSRRLLAVVSVDGVNVVTGKTAAEHQSGYLIDAWGTSVIDGWRKSLHEVATFYFTKLQNSYAARTGRPENVGVIGIALFRERSQCCVPFSERRSQRTEDAARAPHAADEAIESEISTPRSQSQLGTGHGQREYSPVEYVDFERASSMPDETIVIYYDSYRNLVTRGVLPRHAHHAHRRPDPFPEQFVPDPAGRE